MTEDENDDDPVMRSIRSVCLSMRNEDPPSSGLSELLAAARVKAEAMKPSPWWRRMFAVMVRPPMLAAATVVVLVGGGIVISQRTSHEPERADPVAPVDQPVVADKGADHVATPDLDQREQTTTIEPNKPEPAIEAPPRRTTRSRPPRVVEEPKSESAGDVGGAPPPPPPPEDKPSGAGRGQGTEDRLEIASENSVEPTTMTRTPSVEVTRPDNDQSRTSSQPPVDQLVKQAEVAASRKDCPAVRVTVKRIQQLDKGARDRVAKQPAVANCLK